jgi:hypothetical protein
VIPGGLASIPYAWLVLEALPQFKSYVGGHDGLAALAAVLVSIAIGFVLESLGSFVEFYLIDKRRADHEEMLKTWWLFLRSAYRKEPVGQRYLRRFLVTFKFELNTFVAILFAIPGVILLGVTGQIESTASLVILGTMLIFAGLFFFAASISADVLADIRRHLVKGVGEPPFDEKGNPKGVA